MHENLGIHTQIHENTNDLHSLMGHGIESATKARTDSLLGIQLPRELEDLLIADENFDPSDARRRFEGLECDEDIALYGEDVVDGIFRNFPNLSSLSQILTLESVLYDINASRTIALSFSAMDARFSDYSYLSDSDDILHGHRDEYSSRSSYVTHMVTERYNQSLEDKTFVQTKTLECMAKYTRLSTEIMDKLLDIISTNPNVAPSSMAYKMFENLYNTLLTDLKEYAVFNISDRENIREQMGVIILESGDIKIEDGFMTMINHLDLPLLKSYL